MVAELRDVAAAFGESRERYISIDEVARAIHVSRWTLWRLTRGKGIRRYRFTGDPKTYIAREDLPRLGEPWEYRRDVL